MNENIPVMLTIEETAKRTGGSGRKYLVNFSRFIDFLNAGEASSDSIESEVSGYVS